MFRAILITQDPQSVQAAVHPLEKLALESKMISIHRVVTGLPSIYEISLLVNSHDPDILFLDISNWETSAELAALFHSAYPHISIVGFGAGWADEVRIRCEQAGIAELLVSPVTQKEFLDVVRSAIHRVQTTIQENLLAFIPAKAGNGCTTTVLNTAGCLADELDKRVLVIEGDLHSGVLSIMLNAQNRGSVLDALENSSQLDYSLWSNCIVKKEGVDFLMSNRARPLPLWSNYFHLLKFVQSRYDLVLVDLPEVTNEATTEIVSRSKYVFVVCTPEMPSIKLAQRRCRELMTAGVPSERIGIIVNRRHNTDLSELEIEALVEHGIAAIFPNDYASVSKAMQQGSLVDRSSELGKTFLAFARVLTGESPEPDEPRPKSRLGFLKSVKLSPTTWLGR